MSKHLETGKKGEEVAIKHLEKNNFAILEKNWRYSRAEVDIICKEGDVLVFVEVKTRSYDFFGDPSSFVTSSKENLLLDAANPIYGENRP